MLLPLLPLTSVQDVIAAWRSAARRGHHVATRAQMLFEPDPRNVLERCCRST
jgi:hypothetical protein